MGRTMNIQAPEPSDPVFIDGSQSPNDHINGAWVEDLYSNTSQSRYVISRFHAMNFGLMNPRQSRFRYISTFACLTVLCFVILNEEQVFKFIDLDI